MRKYSIPELPVTSIRSRRAGISAAWLATAIIASASLLEVRAAPEVAFAVEVEGNDINDSEERLLTVNPLIALEWPAEQLTMEFKWIIPVDPDTGDGDLEYTAEWLVPLPVWWLDAKFETTDTWISEDDEFEGEISAGLVAFALETEFQVLYERQFEPDRELYLVPSFLHEFALPRGIAGIEVTHKMDADDSYKSIETEVSLTYEFDTQNDMTVGFEIAPVYTNEDEEWLYTATMSLEWPLE